MEEIQQNILKRYKIIQKHMQSENPIHSFSLSLRITVKCFVTQLIDNQQQLFPLIRYGSRINIQTPDISCLVTIGVSIT